MSKKTLISLALMVIVVIWASPLMATVYYVSDSAWR